NKPHCHAGYSNVTGIGILWQQPCVAHVNCNATRNEWLLHFIPPLAGLVQQRGSEQREFVVGGLWLVVCSCSAIDAVILRLSKDDKRIHSVTLSLSKGVQK
ncbi:MAG: hypothetical protein WBP45_14430, partial [Daejeonella sp.]